MTLARVARGKFARLAGCVPFRFALSQRNFYLERFVHTVALRCGQCRTVVVRMRAGRVEALVTHRTGIVSRWVILAEAAALV